MGEEEDDFADVGVGVGGGGGGPVDDDDAADDDAADDDDVDVDVDDDLPVEDMDPSYGDDASDMTYGRRLARRLSSRRWYNPHGRAREEFDAAAAAEGGGDDKEEEEAVETALQEREAEEEEEEDKKEEGNFEEEETEKGKDDARSSSAKPPSLDSAWAYFEHITLPRHFVHDRDDERGAARAAAFDRRTSLWGRTVGRCSRGRRHPAVDVLERAEPGEIDERTALYSVVDTPEDQLADFGVGVGLYFNSLRVLACISLVAGLINIPVIRFFRSAEYSADGQGSISKWVLRGSAVCTDADWKACPTCTKEQWDTFPDTTDRYATAVRNGETLHFILDNDCNVFGEVGLFAFASLLWVCVAVYVMGYYAVKKEVAFDVAQQTTQDYAIEVENPPKDAYDPDEWRDFFQQFGGHVTACTVTLDNEDLIRVLRKRRRLLLKFEMDLPPGVDLDPSDLEGHLPDMPPLPCWKKLLCMPGAEELCEKIRRLEGEIDEMSEKKYDVSNVFVIMETEKAQRDALERLSVRKLDVWRNASASLPNEHLFRGERVLSVREPPEPSSVRWQDLDETFSRQVIIGIITMTISLACIVVGGVLIALARRRSAATAAIVITILNTVTPMAVKKITNLESHSSEGSKQTSQYVKMTFFRWCNTAIITTIITPFTDTVQDGNEFLINGVYAIFIAEMLKTPILQIGDIMGNLNRHYLGPRALDQRRMNLKFAGAAWHLSERYTDMSKVLFLCFFYAVVFPAGFFFTSVTLFVHYWTDKFCLLRTWAPAPRIGTEISKFSRDYFFTLAVLVYAILLAYGYSTFPYDNACDEETPVSDSYVGTYNATGSDPKTGDPVPVSISIAANDTNFFFCNQDLIRYEPPAFPPLPRDQPPGAEWMTPEQERWSSIIGWTSVAVLAFVCVVFLNRIVFAALRRVFFKSYSASGEATEKRFSELGEVYGYVPQVKVVGHPYPKLLCYIDDIDEGLVGWTDPYHPYDFHNLIFDVPKVAKAVAERRAMKKKSSSSSAADDDGHVTDSCLFSIVKNWPPDPSREEEEEEEA